MYEADPASRGPSIFLDKSKEDRRACARRVTKNLDARKVGNIGWMKTSSIKPIFHETPQNITLNQLNQLNNSYKKG